MGPLSYRALQHLLAPGSTQRLGDQLRERVAHWHPEGPAIDVGCADASLLASCAFSPIGIDIAHDRALAFGDAIRADAARLPLRSGSIGLAYSCGLLHHLPDERVRAVLREMRRVLLRGARLLVFDAVLPRSRWRAPLASAIRGLDRGAHMRSEPALRSLVRDALPALRWRIDRVAYAATGLEGLWCVAQAEGPCQ
ncbi:MAG: methyltransferase domain-containing protein [Burkholderiaceae bacterium]|nr:methyltransferase domain-containing protein [Burkholderiaceae bacterium]